MQEKTKRLDTPMGESPKERDYQNKVRLDLIPVVSVPTQMLESTQSAREKSGGCAQFVFNDSFVEIPKRKPTSSKGVN